MKKLVGLGVAVAFILAAGAARAGDWEENFDKAAELAKKEGKYMLVDFSGSDWCGWCKKLEAEVFDTKEWKEYAKQNLVLALVDFPRQKQLSKKDRTRNEALRDKHGVTGFPTVFVMSPDGKVVGKTGYKPGGPEAYIKHVQEFIDADKAKSK